MEVRLKKDLTRYHPLLISGVAGQTVGQYGSWSRASDRFIGVRFAGAGIFDILWDSLDIIDEQYLKQAKEAEEKKWLSLKCAKNVVWCVGPQGGLRYLSYEYERDGALCHYSTASRKDAEETIQFFQKNKIRIKKECVKKKRGRTFSH